MEVVDSYGPPPFATRTDEREGVPVVTFEGELDMAGAPDAAQALADALADRASVVLDLSGLAFIDSSGLAVLFNARRRLGADQRLLVAGSPDAVLRVFRTVRAHTVFELHPSAAAALAALA